MEQFYKNTLSYIRQHPHIHKTIVTITKYSPLIPFIIYPFILIYLFLIHHHLLLATIIKPAFAFLLISFFRMILNRKRPYEYYQYVPLIEHKKGQSFPSRHTLSAMIIALVCFDLHYILGIVLLFVAFIIGLSRIISGVHFISDVIGAMIFAYIIYII